MNTAGACCQVVCCRVKKIRHAHAQRTLCQCHFIDNPPVDTLGDTHSQTSSPFMLVIAVLTRALVFPRCFSIRGLSDGIPRGIPPQIHEHISRGRYSPRLDNHICSWRSLDLRLAAAPTSTLHWEAGVNFRGSCRALRLGRSANFLQIIRRAFTPLRYLLLAWLLNKLEAVRFVEVRGY